MRTKLIYFGDDMQLATSDVTSSYSGQSLDALSNH